MASPVDASNSSSNVQTQRPPPGFGGNASREHGAESNIERDCGDEEGTGTDAGGGGAGGGAGDAGGAGGAGGAGARTDRDVEPQADPARSMPDAAKQASAQRFAKTTAGRTLAMSGGLRGSGAEQEPPWRNSTSSRRSVASGITRCMSIRACSSIRPYAPDLKSDHRPTSKGDRQDQHVRAHVRAIWPLARPASMPSWAPATQPQITGVLSKALGTTTADLLRRRPLVWLARAGDSSMLMAMARRGGALRMLRHLQGRRHDLRDGSASRRTAWAGQGYGSWVPEEPASAATDQERAAVHSPWMVDAPQAERGSSGASQPIDRNADGWSLDDHRRDENGQRWLPPGQAAPMAPERKAVPAERMSEPVAPEPRAATAAKRESVPVDEGSQRDISSTPLAWLPAGFVVAAAERVQARRWEAPPTPAATTNAELSSSEATTVGIPTAADTAPSPRSRGHPRAAILAAGAAVAVAAIVAGVLLTNGSTNDHAVARTGIAAKQKATTASAAARHHTAKQVALRKQRAAAPNQPVAPVAAAAAAPAAAAAASGGPSPASPDSVTPPPPASSAAGSPSPPNGGSSSSSSPPSSSQPSVSIQQPSLAPANAPQGIGK